MYRPPSMNDPSSRTTAQSTPNRAAVLSPLKYRRLTCAPLRPDQDAARPARHPDGERAGPPGRSRALCAMAILERVGLAGRARVLSLIHISEPTRLGMISY